jgi:hypothetical protein
MDGNNEVTMKYPMYTPQELQIMSELGVSWRRERPEEKLAKCSVHKAG